MKKVFTIYYADEREPKRFVGIPNEVLIQRQYIGQEGPDGWLEVALVDAESKQITYSYGIPLDEIAYHEFTTEDDEIIDHSAYQGAATVVEGGEGDGPVPDAQS